jgi:hypothetical protein
MKRLKKFFKPYNWVTIWTCDATGHATTGFGFVYVGKISVKIILQVDNYKGKYRCYMTEGTIRKHLDLHILIDTYPELIQILNVNNIKI